MRRLGYNKNVIIKESEIDKIRKIIAHSYSYSERKGAYERLKIIQNSENKIKLENNIVWESKSIVKFLNNSDELFIIGVTAGSPIIELRDKFLKDGDLLSSVIIDATASETAECLAEWLHGYLSSLLATRQGKAVTKNRFSPGYNDFSLKNQEKIFEVLQLKKIGIILQDNFIMNPEKSITAIIGIL
jgi:cobalamin-dependent methionine synthase I